MSLIGSYVVSMDSSPVLMTVVVEHSTTTFSNSSDTWMPMTGGRKYFYNKPIHTSINERHGIAGLQIEHHILLYAKDILTLHPTECAELLPLLWQLTSRYHIAIITRMFILQLASSPFCCTTNRWKSHFKVKLEQNGIHTGDWRRTKYVKDAVKLTLSIA